ncbi:hypothetical protein GCM10028818_55290 [Spirosoma horti]|jgi:hypothetical protein
MTTKLYQPAQKAKPSMEIEILFNSVEVELARRWAFGEVPVAFVSRQVEDLHKMVKQWWNIYHDSAAAAEYSNRQVWERNQTYPANTLDTPLLVSSLTRIHRLINLEAIKNFRPLHDWEVMAVYFLGMISAYYLNLDQQQTTV